MFKLFFIKKHKSAVLNYINASFKCEDADIASFNVSQALHKCKAAKPLGNSTGETKKSELDIVTESHSSPRADSYGKFSRELPMEKTAFLNADESSNRPLPRDDSRIKYSIRPDKKSSYSTILYSDRERKNDVFDANLVASAMQSHLSESTPAVSLMDGANISFVKKLEMLIKERNLAVSEVYKAANMDRRLFSKITCNSDYQPSKDTVLALIFALKLSHPEAIDLLERAGYTLSHSIKRDIILEYFIKERIYNLNNINAFLYNMNEKIIGRNV